MNRSGAQGGEGCEYHLLAIAIALVLVVKGGGLWSLDSLIAHKLSAKTAPVKSTSRPELALANTH
jgi:hypothetical protein